LTVGGDKVTDLKTEYASMEAAARHIRNATAHLPGAVADFHRASGSLDAFGHLPEAASAKHTVGESMKQLGQFADDLHTEWNDEATALTTIADVLHRVDQALARQAPGKE
jgi:glutamine synthetase type III